MRTIIIMRMKTRLKVGWSKFQATLVTPRLLGFGSRWDLDLFNPQMSFFSGFKRRRQYRPPPSIGQEGRGKNKLSSREEKCWLGIRFLCSVIFSLSTFSHPKSGLEKGQIKREGPLTLMLDWLTARRRMASIQGTSIFALSLIFRFKDFRVSEFLLHFSGWWLSQLCICQLSRKYLFLKEGRRWLCLGLTLSHCRLTMQSFAPV